MWVYELKQRGEERVVIRKAVTCVRPELGDTRRARQ